MGRNGEESGPWAVDSKATFGEPAEFLLSFAGMNAENGSKFEFSIKTLEDLAALGQRLGVNVPASKDVSILSQPVKSGALQLPNSLAIHPMEGCDGGEDGSPGDLTARRYERFAGGGAGLIWFEATAVAPEGGPIRGNCGCTRATCGPSRHWSIARVRPRADRMGADHGVVLVAKLHAFGAAIASARKTPAGDRLARSLSRRCDEPAP